MSGRGYAVVIAVCACTDLGACATTHRPGATPALATSCTPSDDACELLWLERAVGSADTHPDRTTEAFLRATIANDFVRTGASGRRVNREQTLARWISPNPAAVPLSSVLSDMRLVIAKNAAYITELSTERERTVAGVQTFQLRITSVWARRAGRWQLVAEHTSRPTMPVAKSVLEPVVLRVTEDDVAAGDSAVLVAAYRHVPGLSRAARVARYDSTMAEDFLSLRMDGSVSGKTATVARWVPEPRADGAAGPDGFSELTDISVRTFGGIAVVRLSDTQYDSAGHFQFLGHTTDIWRKEGGRWRLAILHVSRASSAVAASEDSATIVALEHDIVRSSAARDAVALDSLIDSTFIGTAWTGRSYGKRAAIARWTAADNTGEFSALTGITVRTFRSAAFAEMTDTQHAPDGRALRASRAIDLFVRDGPRWRLVAGHALPVSPPDDPAVAAEVGAARARWNAAVVRRDTAAVRSLVTDSVAQTSQVFRRIGGDAYVTLMGRIFARRSDLELHYTSNRIVASGDMAFETGRWEERWRENGSARELAGPYYAIWRREEGAWRIAAEMFATID